ncbi:MAG: tetratricopeptide repeat protein, partial [Pirellulales bacterium]
GRSFRSDVLRKWGDPVAPEEGIDANATDGSANGPGPQLSFRIDPFQRVEVVFADDDIVRSIVVSLGEPIDAQKLIGQLGLETIQPAQITNRAGEPIGLAFPERGVVFSMRADGEHQGVEQLILEPIDAEPFMLRAEADLLGPIAANLRDLDFAIQYDDQYARPHALRSKILLAIGQPEAAEAAAARALALAPDEISYRLAWADGLARTEKSDRAVEEVVRILDRPELQPLQQAQAKLLLGRLARRPTHPALSPPIELYVEAVRLASPLLEEQDVVVRRAARRILVDAHLEIAREIGWGNWQQKDRVVPMWLKRASRFATASPDHEQQASPEQDAARRRSVLRIAEGALQAMSGFASEDDPQPWVDIAQRAGRAVLDQPTDPMLRELIEWRLGCVSFYAMQLAHQRGEAKQGLAYGQEAIAHLQRGAEHREATAEDDYLIGRLFFQMGAVHAIHRHDHQRAVEWYERALPVLVDSDGPLADVDPRRYGDALVSMGVSYWEVGDQETAWELTQRGRQLIRNAIDQGRIAESAIDVAEDNLAVMRSAVGGDVRQVSRTEEVEGPRAR